jgi:hypothetical protein
LRKDASDNPQAGVSFADGEPGGRGEHSAHGSSLMTRRRGMGVRRSIWSGCRACPASGSTEQAAHGADLDEGAGQPVFVARFGNAGSRREGFVNIGMPRPAPITVPHHQGVLIRKLAPPRAATVADPDGVVLGAVIVVPPHRALAADEVARARPVRSRRISVHGRRLPGAVSRTPSTRSTCPNRQPVRPGWPGAPPGLPDDSTRKRTKPVLRTACSTRLPWGALERPNAPMERAMHAPCPRGFGLHARRGRKSGGRFPCLLS